MNGKRNTAPPSICTVFFFSNTNLARVEKAVAITLKKSENQTWRRLVRFQGSVHMLLHQITIDILRGKEQNEFESTFQGGDHCWYI